MGFLNISIFAFVLGLQILFPSSLAQNSPQDYLDAHNTVRAAVGVSHLIWDATVASYAQNYTNQRRGDCNLQHSGGPYGENLARGSGDFTGKAAVELWLGEKQYFDYNSISCARGQVCGHYTQVILRNSIRLGCARVQCSNGGWFITCNYDPPGNYVEQRKSYNGSHPPVNYVGQLTLYNGSLVVCTLIRNLVVCTLKRSFHARVTNVSFLDAHNTARAAVGVRPLTWDDTVASYAQYYANKRSGDCNLLHSGGPYGENLAKGTGDLSDKAAVELWVREKQYYNYNTNSCAGGVCGHYTQVVWRNSVRLGCARVQCNNGLWFITCNYDPPGNFVGQRPY